MIKHHLDDATLMSVSAGTLGEPLSIVASAHLSVCKKCRSELRQMDAIGGALLQSASPESLSANALSSSQLASTYVEPEVDERRAAASGGPAADGLPAPLARRIGKPVSDIDWKWLGPGVSACVLPLSDGADGDLRLLRVASGKKLPEHGHGGTELTMIISGAYRDKFGVFGPGDVADLDEDVEHQPIVEPGEPCICIVASEAPAKFKGTLSRLLQPLIGM